MSLENMTNDKIIIFINEVENETTQPDICKKLNINTETYYLWKKLYKNLTEINMKKIESIQKENRNLRKKYRKLSVEKTILQESLRGKF